VSSAAVVLAAASAVGFALLLWAMLADPMLGGNAACEPSVTAARRRPGKDARTLP